MTVWFNRDRRDGLLASYIGVLDGCELIYAIDEGGRQVSSNIHVDSIDVSAYGQNDSLSSSMQVTTSNFEPKKRPAGYAGLSDGR